jgi:hypothetical protein
MNSATLLMRARDPGPNGQSYKRRHSRKAEDQRERNFAQFLNSWRGKSPCMEAQRVRLATRKSWLLGFPTVAWE